MSFIRKTVKKAARFFSLKLILPLVYAKAAKNKVREDKIIFLEISADHLTDSFQLLYERLLQKGYQPQIIYLGEGRVNGVQYLKNCIQMLEQIADARVVFINEASNITSCVKLRPETKLVQTWHGCGAFKRFGFSTAELGWGITGKEMERYPYYRNQSLVSVSAPEVIWAYQDAMHQPEGIIRPLGVSRTDVFFDEQYLAEAYEKLYACFPQARGKKVLLYAPTFRGTQTNATTPQLDIGLFRQSLSKDYVLVINYHPFVRELPQIATEYAGVAKDLTGQMSIQQLLCVSDICISDYSSLVFEYALFERPMIFYAPDLADYFDQRGFYYDYETLTPGPIFTEQAPIIAYINQIEERYQKEEVTRFKERFMSACDGHSTERILEAVGL